MLQRLKRWKYEHDVLAGALGCIGLFILGSLFLLLILVVWYVLLDPETPIRQTASSYFVMLKSNYSGAVFGEPKIANLTQLTVSAADKANGITGKATVALTFIYRESSTSEWKDAEWKLWLEKKIDWKVVDAQKVR